MPGAGGGVGVGGRTIEAGMGDVVPSLIGRDAELDLNLAQAMAALGAAWESRSVVPYIGPGVLALAGAECAVPASPQELVARLVAGASVPHKLRGNLTGAAQFIENFKHRKTVSALMRAAFSTEMEPTKLHRLLAAEPGISLLVHAWYDDLPQRALAGRGDWSMVQAASQAEHFGEWTRTFSSGFELLRNGDAAESLRAHGDASHTLLYQPFGSVSPAANFLVSDSDFVEVLTEIDIQTPIPAAVQARRAGRHFLFLGCHFATQLERIFAYQIMKRSSDAHWAVLPEAPTRNEARFMAQHGILRIDMELTQFVEAMVGFGPVRVV
jgi:hypothetical protein